MRYIFNAEKISLEQAKQGMEAFINANKQSIFDSMSVSLKQDIGVTSVADLTLTKIQEMVEVFVKIFPD
jgi:hypothetical protein